MPSRPLTLALISIAVFSAACHRTPPIPQTSPLKLESRHFEKFLPGCGDLARRPEPCATFRIAWPEVTQAASPQALTRINTALLASLQPAEAPSGFEAEATHVFEQYTQFREEFPNASINYFTRRTAEVLYSTATLLSIEVRSEDFRGGAHPDSHRQYLNFRPTTGERLELSGILRPGALPALTAAVEQRFRAAHGLAPSQPLSDAGFAFDNGRFVLPRHWGASPRGLLFHFNLLEAGPDSLGPSTIYLHWNDLRTFLNKDSGLLPPS